MGFLSLSRAVRAEEEHDKVTGRRVEDVGDEDGDVSDGEGLLGPGPRDNDSGGLKYPRYLSRRVKSKSEPSPDGVALGHV